MLKHVSCSQASVLDESLIYHGQLIVLVYNGVSMHANMARDGIQVHVIRYDRCILVDMECVQD